MEVQGWVVIALTLVLLGYLLPHLVHNRQLLLDSRAEDRFSVDLRVLATVGAEGAGRRTTGGAHHRDEVTRPYLHQRRSEESAVNRPTTRSARAVQDARALAAARAARAAEISRRAAAARRRRTLILTLLLLTAAAWAAVGVAGLVWWVGATFSVVLLAVLGMGRRAAVLARERDAAARAEMAKLEHRLKVAGKRAALPARPEGARSTRGTAAAGSGDTASAATPATARPGAEEDTSAEQAAPARTGEPAAEPDADAGSQVRPEPVGAAAPDRQDGPPQQIQVAFRDPQVHVTTGLTPGAGAEAPVVGKEVASWTPVPVPLPAYTLKPVAPRMDVAPYQSVSEDGAAVPQRPTEASPPSPERVAAESTPVPVTLDLEAVLARRRAAGA